MKSKNRNNCFRCGGKITTEQDKINYFGHEGLRIHRMCGADMNYGNWCTTHEDILQMWLPNPSD